MRRLVYIVVCVLLVSGAWADLPSTGYDTAPATGSAAISTQPGFSQIADLSRLSESWWAKAEDTSPTRARVWSEDGTAEYAFDIIAYNHSAHTGHVIWNRTASTTASANRVRIYPPVAANSAYAASATFGSDNAYAATTELYLPLDEAVNTDPGGYVDRTSNDNDGTGVSMLLTEVAGQVGIAQDFDGSVDYISLGDVASTEFTGDLTLQAWIDVNSAGSSGDFFRIIARNGDGETQANNYLYQMYLQNIGGTLFLSYFHEYGLGTNVLINSANSVSVSGYHHVAITRDATAKTITFYVDGVVGDATGYSDNADGGGLTVLDIGAASDDSSGIRAFSGAIDEPTVYPLVLPANWIDLYYRLTSDQAAYWGIWTWTAPSGGIIPLAASINRRRRV